MAKNEEYGYDLVGNRTTLRKRDGSTLAFQYDGLNRAVRKTVPERAGLTAAQTRDVFYDYDVRGLQSKARFDNLGGEGITSAYDGFGRLLWSNTNQGGPSRSLAFLYNPDGTRSRITHADQAKFAYAHDALGRMTMHYEIRAAPGIDDHIVRYWYNPTGTRYAAVRGAGTVGFTTTAYYDPVDRLASMHNGLPGTAYDLSLTFAYNPASQIVTSTRSNDAYAWNGTLPPSTGYAVNGQNQYTSVAGVTHGYDANGNLTSDGASTFTYDVENRLVAASGARTASLVYDPLGRLFQTSGGTAGVTQFLYDGDALVAEYNASGALLKRYIHGPGADEPVAVYEGPAQGLANRRYTLPDERGSIAALINADGTPSVINSYDPWGVPGTGNAGRFQYTGQAWIGALGLYYNKARFYSPFLGRFMQTDPIGYEDQINLYAYAENDPINYGDPSGLASDCTGSRLDCGGGISPGLSGTSTASITGRPGTDLSSGPPPSPGAPSNGIAHAWPSNGGPAINALVELCKASPQSCAVLGLLALLSGDSAQLPAEPLRTDQGVNTTANISRKNLNIRTLQAARNELRTNSPTQAHGRNWDHVTKVRQGQQGLHNRIQYINRVLANPRTTIAQREWYQRELSRASDTLDFSRRFVP